MADSPAAQPPVIQAEGLGKAYRIWSSPAARLRHPLARALARLLPAALRPASLSEGSWNGQPPYRDFHALRGLNLEIRRGEAVGIIGRNGSGKSTLLQLVAGTLSPSSGRVSIQGRVAALLELGSGFNPEFSGRENVILNATVLGLSRAEIDSRFDAIVAYSEIGEFIDQPVRTYSSGMMLRLAFAVAVHVDPDILIVDEALGVGDARFQLKCSRTIDQFLSRGVTLLFVSHDSSAVKRLCNRALLLERGELVHEGAPNDVVNLYSKLIAEGGSLEAIAGDIARLRSAREGQAPAAAGTQAGVRPRTREAQGAAVPGSGADAQAPAVPGAAGTGSQGPAPDGEAARLAERVRALEELLRVRDRLPEARAAALLESERGQPPAAAAEFAYGGELGLIEHIQVLDTQGGERTLFVSGDTVRVRLRVLSRERFPDPIFALTVKNSAGVEVYGTNTLFSGQPAGPVAPGERRLVDFTMPLNLMPGHYFLSLGFTHFVGEELVVVHRRYDAVRLEVVGRDRSFGIANLNARITVGVPSPE